MADDDMEIDSPIADIDSPIPDTDSPANDDNNLSGRISVASSHRSSMFGSPRSVRAGIRSDRPSGQYHQVPSQQQRRSANMPQQRSPRQRRQSLDQNGMLNERPSSESVQNGLVTTIWGTDVELDDVNNRFRDFITNFRVNDTVLYPDLIETAIEAETWNVNISCQNIHKFDADLYKQLISFPQEVLPVFDEVVNSYATNHFGELLQEVESDKDIWVRPFNLLSTHVKSMRLMDPKDIDGLVSIQGMVIRSTSIIPDIQSAFFRCTLCHNEVDVSIDMGRIAEPTKCENPRCQGVHTMELIHNRCTFKDKQLIKVQESPESIPDGETPQTIDVYVYDQLVDFVKPGDRVEVTGVYRASAIRLNPRRRAVEAVYKTYIDSVHIKKSKSTQFSVEEAENENNLEENEEIDDQDYFQKFDESDESDVLRAERIQRIKELGQKENIYDILVNSLAPSVYQMDDVKKGILCQLMGATKKVFGTGQNERKFRDQINIILCGDPGTSKSQLLQYVYKVAPRGIYTSGKGSSAVGLTAYITKDPDSGDLVLESGALVLSDRGICCIDEFDKMSDSARSILHEVMEQQTVSIAKAGIICTLNARTSILAAANPIESRYNPNKSVVENIDLPPTLISRFDLIYLVLDRPQESLDRKLAKHIVSLYYSEEDRIEMKRRENGGVEQIILSQKDLMEYISYCRRHIQPVISNDAAEKLVDSYVEMRSLGRVKANSGRKTITATPRQLESLIRISESLARMRHSKVVEVSDVDEAVRLHKVATMAAATDPRTGAIDLDSINVGSSAQERLEMQQKANVVLAIFRNYNRSNIRANNLLKRYNATKGSVEEHINLQELKAIIDRLEQNEKVRAGDWLQDDPMIAILDRSDI